MPRPNDGGSTPEIAYPSSPIDIHTPPPPPPPPPPAPPKTLAIAGALVAALAVVAFLLGAGAVAASLEIVAQVLLVAYLAAMPYTSPINNPPPPPPPVGRPESWGVAAGIALCGLAVLALYLGSGPGFLAASAAGVVSTLGGLASRGRGGAVPSEG